jgi:hypothetical protein
MKRSIIIGLISVLAISGFSQKRAGVFTASITGTDRLSIIKNSVSVPSWHEKNFWPLYENYLNEVKEVSSFNYRTLTGMAKMDKNSNDKESFEYTHKMLVHRQEFFKVLEQYYGEMGSAFNGVIALQFLQAESLLDMMECTRIYEESTWKNFRFHAKALQTPQVRAAKHNTIRLAVSLSPDKAEAFWKIYFRYEEECGALLGEDYSIISLYAVEPSDFTPGLSKRLGYDFLRLMQRENKLKEKYFLIMNQAVGASLASRFLAWEDYYSLVSKMYAWVEN